MSGPCTCSISRKSLIYMGLKRTKKADQNTPCGPVLVRSVRSGPLRTDLPQLIEIIKRKTDRFWSATGPCTYPDQPPRSFRTGVGSVDGLKRSASK